MKPIRIYHIVINVYSNLYNITNYSIRSVLVSKIQSYVPDINNIIFKITK